jgi:hypothetical protein
VGNEGSILINILQDNEIRLAAAARLKFGGCDAIQPIFVTQKGYIELTQRKFFAE